METSPSTPSAAPSPRSAPSSPSSQSGWSRPSTPGRRGTSPSPSVLSTSSKAMQRILHNTKWTVYDAVAGRIRPPAANSTRRRKLKDLPPPPALAPEDILFLRRDAPTRYHERDIYWAHDDLPPNAPLPDSELLKAMHRYASHFYEAVALRLGAASYVRQERTLDERSMDGTALLALGILLEEAGREVVGRDGDLVFLEGEDDEEDEEEDEEEDDDEEEEGEEDGTMVLPVVGPRRSPEGGDEDVQREEREERAPKRRKVGRKEREDSE